MASTVLPNGIIIPEKYSRDWYADLYHNWQELDNLLGGGGANDGTLTIQKNGTTVGTFSANQATNETINIEVPTVNDATLTIQQNGTTVDTFTANSSTDKTVDITVPTKTSDLTNDSGFITEDTTKIPLTGSNAISGDLIPATDGTVNLGGSTNNYNTVYTQNIFRGLSSNSLILSGGNSKTNGANLVLYGKDRTDGFQGNFLLTVNDGTNSYVLKGHQSGMLSWSGKLIRPTTDGGATLGVGSIRFGQIYSTNSAISTSDERQKDNIKQIDDKLLQAWENVNIVQFNFKDALEKKGENARLHTGYIAQNIQQACEENGINPNDYGLFCHDSWEEQEEKKDENGQVIEPYRAKGDLYSLRYEEALVVECAYLRKCIKELRTEIEELKKGNNVK